MSKLICSQAIDSAQRDLFKAGIWIVGSGLLLMLMCVSLTAQDDAATQKQAATPPVKVLKIPAQYVEPVEQDNESRDESRARRAELKKVRDLVRGTQKELQAAVEGSGNFNSVSNKFASFMQEYEIARMTQTDDATLASMGEMRKDFLDDYLSDKVTGGTRQRVIQTTIPILQQIVEGNFHKAVRLNAVLILGRLDDRAANRSAGVLPEPSNDALRFLTQIFTADKNPAYLKIGALAGIQRHTEINRLRAQPIPNANAIQGEALAIVQGGGTGSNTWPPEAKYWLKRRSTQVLGYLGQPGTNDIVVDELIKIAADENASTWLRFDAMAALGNLNYAGVGKEKVTEVPKIVGNFVADTLESESEDLEDKLYRLIGTNILYDDTDLEKIGNADDDKNNRPSRNIGTGMTGGEGTFGRSSQEKKKTVDLGPRVEIATYHLNNARQKVKVIAFTAKQTLSSTSLAEISDKALLARLNAQLEDFIEDADVGIKNLDEPELEIDEDDPEYETKLKAAKKTNTLKMSELFAAAAKDIRRVLPVDPVPAEKAAPGSN